MTNGEYIKLIAEINKTIELDSYTGKDIKKWVHRARMIGIAEGKILQQLKDKL